MTPNASPTTREAPGVFIVEKGPQSALVTRVLEEARLRLAPPDDREPSWVEHWMSPLQQYRPQG